MGGGVKHFKFPLSGTNSFAQMKISQCTFDIFLYYYKKKLRFCLEDRGAFFLCPPSALRALSIFC